MNQINRADLSAYLDNFLNVRAIQDYTINGLQVEGRPAIQTLVTGVTACQALLDEAVRLQADAVMVHHGYFWKSESPAIHGMKKKRLQTLLQHDINLFAYHLPLDVHPEVGNNAQLARVLGIEQPKVVAHLAKGLIWQGQLPQPMTALQLQQHVQQCLQRQPLLIESGTHVIKQVAWCTGGAQDFIDQVPELAVDAYISGEASERTFHSAVEQQIHYLGAGHHATERYGIQALGQHLQTQFGLNWHHVDIDNPI
jgi:dinuclear metal center YbgI/SA1388 family protein